ncbi:MAG: hypothetical protein LUH18_10765 [Oscillospiraceae bacterium]|nr:hypothetical protein [Oscillospiraceae bacterium]
MKKVVQILNIAVFLGFLIVLAVVSLAIPEEDYSETENRYLAEMPDISISDWFSGDYSEDLTSWLDDHFAMRTNWISLHTSLELLQGRNEVNGVYITSDRLLELTDEIDYSVVDNSLEAITYLSELSDTPVYVMLVPTAAEIYSDEVSYTFKKVSQRELINYAYNYLSENSSAETIDVYSTLYSAREEYIYYRTDHHWTSTGAYLAYISAADTMGYTASTLDKFDVKYASHSFYGSLHSKVLYDGIEADIIEFYLSNSRTVSKVSTDDDGNTVYSSVFDESYLSGKDKYLCYLGSNTAFTQVVSNSTGGKLLVIKDSYANCFIPFLAENYSEIDIIDLRYLTTLGTYISDLSDYDSILILYNAQNFAEDTNLPKLKLLKN